MVDVRVDVFTVVNGAVCVGPLVGFVPLVIGLLGSVVIAGLLVIWAIVTRSIEETNNELHRESEQREVYLRYSLTLHQLGSTHFSR